MNEMLYGFIFKFVYIFYFDFYLFFREIKVFIYDLLFIDFGVFKMFGCLFKVVGNLIIIVVYVIGFFKNLKWRDLVLNLLFKY